MPRDVARRVGLVALVPALFATAQVVGPAIEREGGRFGVAGLLIALFVFAMMFGFSFAGVLLLPLLGRWLWPDSHMEHATHCDVCQSRKADAEARYSSKSSA